MVKTPDVLRQAVLALQAGADDDDHEQYYNNRGLTMQTHPA